ncbi:MAG TPA: TonB-dependent receptor [Steroidobacter sp.]|uniref:TonB-dependent receptor n=1 Tax=Steroidobacter sp. TaxID=1978227 RepID=UPI002ED915CD
MRMKLKYAVSHRPWLMVPMLASLTAIHPAGAAENRQSTDSSVASLGLEEVVVTSRKRDERVQEVPDSIFVLSAAQLEVSNVEGLRDFVDLTPNLMVRETFRPNESFLTMRGLAGAQGALPPVAFIVDGVQLGSNDFINQDLFDIERIEVLRGPQGALYGQGAIAGAINVVTKQPTNTLEGFVKSSYGNGNALRVAGAVSGPLVQDKLFARVSGYYRDSDGLIENARGQDIDPAQEQSVRALLSYRGERLNAQLRGSYTEGNASCCMLDRVPLDAAGNLLDIDDVTNPGSSSNILGTTDDELSDASLRLEYDFGPLTLTSISGYAEVSQRIFGDADYTSDAITSQDITFASDVFNQELRLASNDAGRFNWLLGGFLQDRQERQDITVGGDGGPGVIVAPLVLRQKNVVNSRSWAGFAQVSFEATERLELTAAARYDRDEQDSRDTLNRAATFKEATFTEFQPKMQIGYRWTDDFLFYTSYARGFRAGGFTQNTKFDNEVTDNYEIGFKSTMLDGLLTLNASAFHIDYSNQQIAFVILTPTAAVRGVVNIPASDIDGLEVELSARPTNQLTLSAGLGVVDSVIRDVAPNALFGDDILQLRGNKSPLVSPLTFNASATWRQPIGADLDLLVHGDFRRLGGYYFDAQNTLYTATANFMNGKIALTSGRWELGLWGRNLTDTRVATYLSPTGSRTRGPNQPRSYGVEATLRF